jgi:hypothetical protein
VVWPARSTWFLHRYVIPALLVGGVLFAFGWLIAAEAHVPVRYVTSLQIVALAVATTWVFAWGAWSTDQLRAIPAAIRPALREPGDRGYQQLTGCWHDWVFKTWPIIGLGLAWFILALLPVWAWNGWEEWFPSSWGEDAETAERLILTLYFLIGSALFVTMLWGFGFYVYFARRALQHPLALAPNLARTCLRPMTLFGLKTGAGWSVAVTLGLVFFWHNITYAIGAFLIVLAVMGFVLILAPQILAHSALRHTRDELIVKTGTRLPGASPDEWLDDHVLGTNNSSERARRFLIELHATPVWVYSPLQVLVLLTEILVALVPTVVRLLEI